MKKCIVLFFIAVVFLSIGCISEEAQIQTTLPPETTLPPVETTISPFITAPPTTTPALVVTTNPPTTTPQETLGPVSDYLLKKGLYGLDVSPLEEDGSLDENDKTLIDIISNLEIKTSFRETPFPSIIEDGVVSDEELIYSRLRVKVEGDIGSKYVDVIDSLWGNKPSLIFDLSETLDKDTETVTKAFTLLEMSQLESYLRLYKKSSAFSKMSWDLQKFILDAGITDSAYINVIPVDFDPNDKTKDTDGGGVEDYYEIQYQGLISDNSDDIQLQIENAIPGKGFFTLPFRCEIGYDIVSWFDLDPQPKKVRNWKGETDTVSVDGARSSRIKVSDGHYAIDFVMPVGEEVLAAADGIVSSMRLDTRQKVEDYIVHFSTINSDYGMDYGHLIPLPNISVGIRVKRGDVIGNKASHFYYKELVHLGFFGYESIYEGANDPYRDIGNSNSQALWVNDNDPLCLSEDGTWKPISEK